MAVAAAAAAAATATTITPTTTTHGRMQLVLEHCCGPLIRGNYAGGVRGEKKRFSVWISLLTPEKNGGGCSMEDDGLRAEGEFLFYLACVENDWRIACWKLRWFPAVLLTKIMRGENMIS